MVPFTTEASIFLVEELKKVTEEIRSGEDIGCRQVTMICIINW
jgi:hypothetical protein